MFEVSESTLRFCAVERQREEAALGDPEVVVEAPLQLGRLALELAPPSAGSFQTSRARRARPAAWRRTT